jgi:hypothetical protein
MEAAADVLLGTHHATGRLPVALSEAETAAGSASTGGAS